MNIEEGEGGFTEIFRRMIQLQNIEVKYNHEVVVSAGRKHNQLINYSFGFSKSTRF